MFESKELVFLGNGTGLSSVLPVTVERVLVVVVTIVVVVTLVVAIVAEEEVACSKSVKPTLQHNYGTDYYSESYMHTYIIPIWFDKINFW